MSGLSALAASLAAALAASAAAVAAPSSTGRPIVSHCSRTGDLCYGVTLLDNGETLLRIDTIGRSFGRYTLCVRPPVDTSRCRSFRMSRVGRTYSSGVVLERAFGMRSRGAYAATWKLAKPLGPTLRFRR